MSKHMHIKFSNAEPPIWAFLVEKYGEEPWDSHANRNTVLAFDGVVYCKNPAALPPDIVEHEKVHLRQQREFDGGLDEYVRRYYEDKRFRYEVELEAYIRQLAFIVEDMAGESGDFQTMHFRNALEKIVVQISGPLYGNMVSYEVARHALITGLLSHAVAVPLGEWGDRIARYTV